MTRLSIFEKRQRQTRITVDLTAHTPKTYYTKTKIKTNKNRVIDYKNIISDLHVYSHFRSEAIAPGN